MLFADNQSKILLCVRCAWYYAVSGRGPAGHFVSNLLLVRDEKNAVNYMRISA